MWDRVGHKLYKEEGGEMVNGGFGEREGWSSTGPCGHISPPTRRQQREEKRVRSCPGEREQVSECGSKGGWAQGGDTGAWELMHH